MLKAIKVIREEKSSYVNHKGENVKVIRKSIMVDQTKSIESPFKEKNVHKLDRKFYKKIRLINKIPKIKATKSQLSYITNLMRKQIGDVNYSYNKHGRFLSKQDAAKLIRFLEPQYNDIEIILKIEKKKTQK